MDTFCTIVTSDYMHYALGLYDSLSTYTPDAKLQVLVVDEHNEYSLPTSSSNFAIHKIDHIQTSRARIVFDSYYHDQNKYRWTMKSVFISFLLDDFDKVIFLDPDINFFENAYFLFDQLDEHNVLLTPHWRVADARIPKNDMIRIFDHGIHNAGFVASNKKGKEAMEWWTDVCLFRCEKDKYNGIWDDQAYLSIMHLFFDGVHILKHMGCNVSYWNYRFNKRLVVDSNVLLGGKYPVVFIHFDADTIGKVKDGTEDYLEEYLDQYENRLTRYRSIYNLGNQ